MSDYSSVGGNQQNFNQTQNHSQAFAAALLRAKQIAAKINPSGEPSQKRPLDDCGPEPENKKHFSRLDSHSPPHRSSSNSNSNMVPPGLAPPGIGGPVTSEDIKVPDKMVGLIIGRGGEQITRLQSESGCKIQMAPDSGGMPDRLCTLTGNPAAIGRAKELVNAIVHQRYKTEPGGGSSGPPRLDDMIMPQQQHGGGGGGSSSGGGGGGNPSFVEVMIPGPKVGLIIGKGGETIKLLQEKSGAKMVVIQEGPNQEIEKPLRITGDPQKVEHAKSLVYELLAEKEMAQQRGPGGRGGSNRGGFNERGGQQRSYQRGGGGGGEESTYAVPASKCGVIIGRGGETIKQINQATGAHCELDRRPHSNSSEKVFIIRGSADQIDAAKQMIADKIGLGGQGGSNGGPSYGGGGMGGSSGGPPNQQQGYNQSWAPPGSGGGGGGGPSYGQPFHQQHMDPNSMGGGGMGQQGQPDYSVQWMEYYRSLGMHQEADAIEQQAKAKNMGGASMQPSNSTPVSQPGQQSQQNGQPDYSAQWAQYYRTLGKVKEAEMIENQMKSKQGGSSGQPNMVQQPGGGSAGNQASGSNSSSGPQSGYQQYSQQGGGYPYQASNYPYQQSGYQYQGVQQSQSAQEQ